jgi:serine/threonine-protein kinase
VNDDSDEEVEAPGEAPAGVVPRAHELIEPDLGDLERRYELRRELGRGGMGHVLLSRDRTLGRQVAVKTIPASQASGMRRNRFLAEARITSQLAHPGIPPIHDLFRDADGALYYSMKLVRGQTLGEVIEALRGEDVEATQRYNLVRLLSIFLSACQALAYAHTRRVVHRDLKPDNIMVGDFGEVLVMDWGLARMLEESDDPADPEIVDETGAGIPTIADPALTQEGTIVGSPAYMAPESQEGDSGLVGTASDVYSLGILLYELLTLRRPFEAESLPRLLYLKATARFTSPSQRCPKRDIPEEVEEICLKAMALKPQDRYQNAGEITAELKLYLEGVRPRSEADRLVRSGLELMVQFADRAREADDAELRAMALRSELNSWDPLEIKRLAWEAERVAADDLASADEAFSSCEAAFESALSHVRDYRPARIGLADLYWLRFLQAEANSDPRWMQRCRERIERYAPGRYQSRLVGNGSLSIMSTPLAAEVWLYPLVEHDGRREAGTAVPLGRTLVTQRQVAMGSYLLRIEGEGYAPLELPLVVGRLQDLMIDALLVPAERLHPDFIQIAAGPALLGGDPAALSGFSEIYVDLPDYAIARYPVTTAEYLQFLSALWTEDREMAQLRMPKARGSVAEGQRALFDLEDDGSYRLPITDRQGRTWHAEQPIVSVTIEDARAYAEWFSRSSGYGPVRLPTESEWEKAARGADRRVFPWGDRFDATFCVMSESSADPPSLPAVGGVPTDTSPYGVRDLAGGVRDWVLWDDESTAPGDSSPLRGGSYGTVEVYSRCSSRSVVPHTYLGSHVGFRLLQELSEKPVAEQ